MKPNFAFTLSYKGVGLLQRAFPGWHTVGEVNFDVPDLTAALADLRQKADQLDPTGLRSKLVIPNDQIKYLALPAMDMPTDNGEMSPQERVRAALVDATPYEVDDLAFDWKVTPDQILIAAVAKETLTEAESFANEHDFRPVCFVATPEADRFEGEPFFGQTRFSETVLEAGQNITRDLAAITVVGSATFPASQIGFDENIKTEKTQTQDAPETSDAAVDPLENNDEPIAEFSSIRAHRGEVGKETSRGAPRLNGVDRVSGAMTAPSIPISKDDDLAAPSPPTDRITAIAPDDGAAEVQFTDTHIAPMPDMATDMAVDMGISGELNPPETDSVPKESFFSRRSRGRSREKPAEQLTTSTPISSQIPTPEDEKQRMTVFGARQNNDIGGKPRHLGLILTMVLLVFLAGVAAWATIFLDDGLAGLFSPNDAPVIALPVPIPGEDELATELAIEGDEAAIAEPITQAPPLQDLASQQPEDTDPATPLPQPIDNTPAFDPDQAVADYAATGIWQTAPDQPQVPGFQGLDSLYITSIDRAVISSDAVALPQAVAALSDHQPRTQLSPVAPEVRFAYDARGLVIATKDGALTPDGITVFLGRPISTPPTRPTRFAQNPVLVAQTIRLAKTRPRPRPGNLIEQNQRSTLGGRTLVEMARLRPTARPHVAAEKLAEEADETATAQAVTTSRKPSARPRNFDRIVQRAQRQQETVTTVAAVAPRTVTPSVPSTASVARLATARNAINLRRINLIGVYGKPSSRRALVRLANGRYKKVKIGDRIDGGRISSIGESELRYVKSGRNVVLKMPRG